MDHSQNAFAPRLARSKEDADSYPLNLFISRDFPYTLAVYQTRLDEIEKSLFYSRKSEFTILDSSEANDNKFQSHEVKDISKLKHVLESTSKDPHRRLIFLQSASSRGPLLCTREQMTYLFTHHQVMASFLDFVFTFKRREEPHSSACFRYENYLNQRYQQPELRSIGRSGAQIQHCFNILGIEADKKNEGEWLQRQVAVYHSFDLLECRALWIIIKGDATIQNRVVSTIDSVKQRDDRTITKSLPSSFRLTLEDQILFLQWGTENWEHYIHSLEAKYARFSSVAQHAPVEDMVQDIPGLLAADRMLSWPHEPLSPQAPGGSQPASPTEKVIRRLSTKVSTFTRGHEMVTIQKSPSPKQPDLKLEDLVSFNQLQSLSLLSKDITQAMSVIDQNKQLMVEIKSYYQELVNSTDFELHIRENDQLEWCKTHASDFVHQLGRLEGDLTKHQARLKEILNNVEKMELMLNTILQYRNMRTGEYFAKSSQNSADIMQIWTQDMHEKTISMHVITVFTLIFLPGTFVATIFSSGILTFGDDSSSGFGPSWGDWKVRQSALRLYFAICLPLLLLTLIAWGVAYCVARMRRSSHRRNKVQDQVNKIA